MSTTKQSAAPAKPSLEVSVPVVYKPGQAPGSVELHLTPLELGFVFGKMTDTELVDAIPLADKYFKGLEKWLKAAKEVAKNRFTAPTEVGAPTIVRGAIYQAIYAKMERTDIDRDKVRAKYGDAGYAELCTKAPYYQISFKPVTAEGASLDESKTED